MFIGLLITAIAFELEGVAGVILADYPSRLFSLSAHALTVGIMVGLYALHARKQAAEAAFDLGVEVGTRRGRKIARPVIVAEVIDIGPGAGKHEAPTRRLN
jgi:hypothetical protein